MSYQPKHLKIILYIQDNRRNENQYQKIKQDLSAFWQVNMHEIGVCSISAIFIEMVQNQQYTSNVSEVKYCSKYHTREHSYLICLEERLLLQTRCNLLDNLTYLRAKQQRTFRNLDNYYYCTEIHNSVITCHLKGRKYEFTWLSQF